MANQLSALLQEWYPNRDNCDWVLGTVYKTEGPCYRKAGAMMLFNSFGQQFGMLSGGCLESDIQTHARKVMQTGIPVTLCYDGSDEDDLAFQLGIGCGGTVYVLLQPVNRSNSYQQLDLVYESLLHRKSGYYGQMLPSSVAESIELSFFQSKDCVENERTTLIDKGTQAWVMTAIHPDPHILIIGGGIDARPVVTMAKQLGWEVSVWDPRPANARREFFLEADFLLDNPVETLPDYVAQNRVQAVVAMSHNVSLDAEAILQLHRADLQYMALLGPENRKQKVLQLAGLRESDLTVPLSGPAGLNIGGELPESIALSILSECHARLMLEAKVTAREELAA
ncbi:XdhC family protein [Neptuniibacter sp.]|uniref:XdhC family protein n=1 Tax=Neptuniibacter sp. TaxID=1962643 RepID=UPI00260A7280|nr:XdhC/CoxI family protein [Neptuniibacter sp.]MCP4597622.1 XdhC family protein [Neptuniibacter sp.]